MNIKLTIIALFVFIIHMPLNAQEKIQIGVIAPLSGGMATIGNAIKNGIEMAKSDHPELFSQIEFIY